MHRSRQTEATRHDKEHYFEQQQHMMYSTTLQLEPTMYPAIPDHVKFIILLKNTHIFRRILF